METELQLLRKLIGLPDDPAIIFTQVLKYLYINVQNSTSHNSQKVESIQKSSTDEWINKLCDIYNIYYSTMENNLLDTFNKFAKVNKNYFIIFTYKIY